MRAASHTAKQTDDLVRQTVSEASNSGKTVEKSIEGLGVFAND
jgi:hypothetical protein